MAVTAHLNQRIANVHPHRPKYESESSQNHRLLLLYYSNYCHCYDYYDPTPKSSKNLHQGVRNAYQKFRKALP
eukprot:1449588-Amphidinium_carterae.1